MSALLERHAAAFASEALDAFPALVIQGARQVGKSTFAQILSRDRRALLLTLDDPSVLDAARSDPVAFVTQFAEGTLVIDEVQRAPELILPVKASIDRDRRPGRFILTGSSDLLRMSRTPDSLAGRAVSVHLRTLSQGEIAGRHDDLLGRLKSQPSVAGFTSATDRAGYVEALSAGGYPEARLLSPRLRNAWFDSYVERLMEHDLPDVAPRVDRGRMTALLRLVAANQAGELVKARLARDSGVPESSVTTYLDLLETMYLTESLAPWTPNLTSRESSRRKQFVSDPALALRLSRVSAQQLAPIASPFLGAAVEAFVAGELFRQQSWSAEEFELFHYRDRDGREVDIVAEFFDGSVIGLEVKSGATYRTEHFTGLRLLRERLGDRFLGGYVLGTAAESIAFGDRLWGLPISALWELGSGE